MRILIIQPWIRLGGAELISVHLAYYLERQGHRAPILCTFADMAGMPEQAHAVDMLLPHRRLSELCQRYRLLFLLIGPWLLLRLVWKHSRGADVLNPHNFPASWIAVVVGAIRRIPVIWTCNEPPERIPLRNAWMVGVPDYLGWLAATSWIDSLLIKRVAAIHAPSQKTRQQVLQRYGRDSKVIQLGIDLDFFENGSVQDLEEKFDIQDKFVLLSVGKLHPQKNQIVCLDALRRILGDIPNSILLLAGNGPSTEKYKQVADEWGLADRVRFMGHLSTSEVQTLYRICDVNLFPAVNQSWGFTPFEALCASKISIVSNDCGAAEILESKKIGLVCEPTGKAFAGAIRWVYLKPTLQREMAIKGRSYVKRHLTWERYAGDVIKLMRSSLAASISQTHSP